MGAKNAPLNMHVADVKRTADDHPHLVEHRLDTLDVTVSTYSGDDHALTSTVEVIDHMHVEVSATGYYTDPARSAQPIWTAVRKIVVIG